MEADDGVHMEFVRASAMVPGVASATGYRSAGRIPALHRGLPSPYLTFIFSLDAPITVGASPTHVWQPRAPRHGIILAGMHMEPTYVVQQESEAGIQLAIHPLAARALFGVPARELGGSTFEGADVLGPDAEKVRCRLFEESSWERRFEVLADYLHRRAEAGSGTHVVRPELREAWAWMARHGGNGSMTGLAEHVCLGSRQLTNIFDREIGLGPKAVNRLMRFHQTSSHIAATLAAGGQRSLAKTAYDCGYADQSHLVRDFRQFTGTTPTGWIAEEFRNIQAGGHRNGAESEA